MHAPTFFHYAVSFLLLVPAFGIVLPRDDAVTCGTCSLEFAMYLQEVEPDAVVIPDGINYIMCQNPNLFHNDPQPVSRDFHETADDIEERDLPKIPCEVCDAIGFADQLIQHTGRCYVKITSAALVQACKNACRQPRGGPPPRPPAGGFPGAGPKSDLKRRVDERHEESHAALS